ncbi:MAG: glycerol-3-phosphate responsive antiterminator [Ruminococcaceae bacterium]|nr:glycerol-3-phosphate responsive antiterminator [Oscillospiraceae bacterium]
MTPQEMFECLERNPVIAAVHEAAFDAALASPAEVIFYLKANLLTVAERVRAAHGAGKCIFVHIDLAEGIGKDRIGIEYLASVGVDGVISTRTQLLRQAKEHGLVAIQRFFALDSQGMESISETLESAAPDLIEIMPGVIGKAISRFAGGRIPVIAGGLIETKKEVMAALDCGAIAVSTGKKELFDI